MMLRVDELEVKSTGVLRVNQCWKDTHCANTTKGIQSSQA